MKQLRAPKRTVLRAVRPSHANEVAYRRVLLAMIEEMHRSVRHFVLQAYAGKLPHAHPDMQAQDESPASRMQGVMNRLTQRWTRKFNRRAPGVAGAMATAAQTHSDSAMRAALGKAGFSVKFDQTRAMNDVFQATAAENVGLIKSIPQKYLGEVQGLVMRSVAGGREVKELADALQERFKVAKNRAWFIARDQNNKATSQMNRARQRQLGIKKGIWVHTPSSIHPREAHLEADGTEYDLEKGCLIDGEYIQTGEEPNCGCVSASVIEGFDEEEE